MLTHRLIPNFVKIIPKTMDRDAKNNKKTITNRF